MFQPLFLLWRGKRVSSIGAAVLAAVLALGVLVAPAAGPAAAAPTKTYSNPLTITIPGGGRVESCADPTVLSAQVTGDGFWYAYCTTDPLNDHRPDRRQLQLPPDPHAPVAPTWSTGPTWAMRSDQRPSWVDPTAGLWAPEVQASSTASTTCYHTASDTAFRAAAALLASPPRRRPLARGPTPDAPAVEPHDGRLLPGGRRWVFDPDVVTVGGQNYIFYGSLLRRPVGPQLSADGLTSDPATQVPDRHR